MLSKFAHAYDLPMQGARLDTLGTPLSWVLHSCGYEFRELSGRPSCPMVSAKYSSIICQPTFFVGVWWYGDSHQQNLNDRVYSYVLAVVLGSKYHWGCVYRHHSFVIRGCHPFSQWLLLRAFSSEFRSQVDIRALTTTFVRFYAVRIYQRTWIVRYSAPLSSVRCSEPKKECLHATRYCLYRLPISATRLGPDRVLSRVCYLQQSSVSGFQRPRNAVSETDPGFAIGKLTNSVNVRLTCSADSFLLKYSL
ncbi:hypothetical protein EDB92DRAFT_677832 [Lactarius akahatsu]|uniref:Uncharacterized protein n=1 Tax=Lactarius akahatsu TaxID=416441 RepID=A0AAD4L2X5_9AGAM|nr:hypothetical protein EDB92DRAFT_677832 [Lactarius akahatsu]